MKRTLATLAAVVVLVGCTNTGAAKKETDAVRQSQAMFLQSQPVPQFNWSQLRQNLVEIETAQANTTATTSFMFLLAGAGSSGPMVHSCPSIGFPIPSTYQLTNPQGKLQGEGLTVPQMEATGVYTGDTTGTFVMCVGADGKPFAFYHEGYVSTVTGPAHWDLTKGEIVMDGTSSAAFTAKK